MASQQIALGTLLPSVAVTIASSQTKSGVISCLGMVPVQIALPATFTGTALTFEVCSTVDGTFNPLYGMDGNAVTMTVAQGRTYAIDPANFEGIMYMKVVSGSTEGSARSLVLSLKGK